VANICLAVLLAACAQSQSDEMTGERAVGSTVFTIPEADLLPENVAHDPRTGAYYVGSTRKGKILRVLGGEVSEFKPPRSDGLWMVVGMKVDTTGNSLWVCSTEGENLVGLVPRAGRSAGLFRFDLESGRLLDRWLLDGPDETHFLNDVVVDSEGVAYVTHMFEDPAIWIARPGGALERFVELPARSFPNGITLSTDESALYVATARGIVRVDRRDRSIALLDSPTPEQTRGVDGLYATADALIGVRPEPGAVLRYELEAGGRAIRAITPLLEGHPAFRGPTTGVLVGRELHVVANAQFDLVGPNGSLPPMAELTDPVVLAVPVGTQLGTPR
jgi:sugar lactone lactonase YvrE